MKQSETNFTSKNPKEFVCELCDFIAYNKKDFTRHINTIKHNKKQNETIKTPKNPRVYECPCGDIFNSRTTLWRHKKTCTNITIQDLANEEKQQQLIEYLLKENSEFKQLMIDQHNQMLEQNKHMIEMSKNAGHHNTNNSHNTTNNSFNLQFFLNETCKDAMNIMDFVSQLQVGNTDLEETGRLGFANGISKIFINGLKQINISDRPIHCSDFKRETLYIKNNNEWNKEDENKKLLTTAIKHVAHKGIKQISTWTKEHPGYNDPDSKVNDRYLKIVSESMSGSTEDETNKNYTKIIKNIVKETVIDK
jgi:hypothetical protein